MRRRLGSRRVEAYDEPEQVACGERAVAHRSELNRAAADFIRSWMEGYGFREQPDLVIAEHGPPSAVIPIETLGLITDQAERDIKKWDRDSQGRFAKSWRKKTQV
jgi:hypothetical protein